MPCDDAESPHDDDPEAVRAALHAADLALEGSSRPTAAARSVAASAPRAIWVYLVVEFLLDLLSGAL